MAARPRAPRALRVPHAPAAPRAPLRVPVVPRAHLRARLPVSWLCIVLQYNAKPSAAFRSQYTRLYCDTVLHPPSCLSHNTISCLAIQFFFLTNYTSLQYNLLYCNTTSSPQAFFFVIQNLYCNTIFNTLSTCNTLQISTPVFFFRFSLYIYIYIYIYISIISSSWKNKKYTPNIFFHNTQINL